MHADDGTHGLEQGLRVLYRLENGVLALLLGVMIVLAPAQIVLRNFFDADLAWGDALLRLLVLWVGLLGALMASRTDRHISVDVLSRLLSERAQGAARMLTSAFTAAVTGLVAYHGGRLVASEFEFGAAAFASLPAWAAASIIPFAFGLIAVRHALLCARWGRALVSGRLASQ
jgi:TRAP-type C4-dicarboxylate transport system permease small subunit